MNRLQELFVNVWGLFHNSRLPAGLEMPDVAMEGFVREAMMRAAGLSASMNMRFGIFELLGEEFAKRASRAWWPPEVLLMEDISLAFEVVEHQRRMGLKINPIDVRRLEWLVGQYFQRLNVPRSREDVVQLIDVYLRANSLPDTNVPRFQPGITRIDLPLLKELRTVDKEISGQFQHRGQPGSLGDVGLYLSLIPDRDRYESCTPLNCMTFACTGGDGDHFSLLMQNGAITASSPVVVTLPSEGESKIAGESLHDFLCLGTHTGYFQIGSNFQFCGIEGNLESRVDEWHTKTWGDDRHYRNLLTFLTERLRLKPWTDRQHYDELQARFLPMLVLPPDAR